MEVLYHIRIYKAIFWGYIPLHSPYIGLIYGRYLQFRFLKWPLTRGYCIKVRVRPTNPPPKQFAVPVDFLDALVPVVHVAGLVAFGVGKDAQHLRIFRSVNVWEKMSLGIAWNTIDITKMMVHLWIMSGKPCTQMIYNPKMMFHSPQICQIFCYSWSLRPTCKLHEITYWVYQPCSFSVISHPSHVCLSETWAPHLPVMNYIPGFVHMPWAEDVGGIENNHANGVAALGFAKPAIDWLLATHVHIVGMCQKLDMFR